MAKYSITAVQCSYVYRIVSSFAWLTKTSMMICLQRGYAYLMIESMQVNLREFLLHQHCQTKQYNEAVFYQVHLQDPQYLNVWIKEAKMDNVYHMIS